MRKLKVLGCGDAFATGGRHTTSFYVINDEASFLIDCGVSTLVRLKQEGIRLSSIKNVFITHFHGDHYGGVPFLILSNRIEHGGQIPMTFYGPPGVKEQVTKLMEALYPGTSSFIDALPLTFIEYDLNWQQVAQELEVQAVPVTHSPPALPYGLRFRLGEKILAFSGDTEWDDNLVELTDGAEMFITECNNYLEDTPGHLSLQNLLDRRNLFNCRQIWLSHMGKEMLELDDCPFDRLEDGLTLELW